MSAMAFVVVLASVTLVVGVCILVVLVRHCSTTSGVVTSNVPIQAERIELGPEYGPLVTVQSSRYAVGVRAELCHLPDATKAHLSKLLIGAPTAALAGLNAASQSGSYLLSFAPAVQAGLADGSLRLMDAAGGGWRAVATDGSRIAGQGTLTSAGPTAVSVGAAVWAVAAFITAQKYLADIDKRLLAIETAVDRLQTWNEHEIRAQVEADTRYLLDVFGSIRDGEMCESGFQEAVTQLGTIDREISQRVVELRLRLDDLVSNAENSKLEIGLASGGTLDSHRDRLGKQAEEARRWLADLVGALHVKGAVAHLRCGLPSDAGFARRRVADLRSDIEDASLLRDRFQVAMEGRASELVGSWTSAEADLKAQSHVRAIADRASKYATKHIDGATEAAKQVDAIAADRLIAGRQPLQLIVTLEGGAVTNCRRVVSPAP